MALPDFVIIGAMKCGTSTLHAQLAAQPGVFMSDLKEPNFFSDDAVHARGRAWYEGLFSAAEPGDLKGESSTHYTKLPTYRDSAKRMAELLTAPKLIYVLRDPVERAVSHYLHEWSLGGMGDDVERAFGEHPELVDYGRYAMQIEPYVRLFGKDAILLLRAETMDADPHGTMARVGAFLGRSDLCWDTALGRQNASAERTRRLPFHGLLVDNGVATLLRRTLVPKAVRNRIRQGRQRRDRPALPADLRARLGGHFAEDRRALERMFPDDPALFPAW